MRQRGKVKYYVNPDGKVYHRVKKITITWPKKHVGYHLFCSASRQIPENLVLYKKPKDRQLCKFCEKAIMKAREERYK